MLISGKKKFVQSPFVSEDELKKMVIESADYFFGPSAFCLSKELISSREGFEVIPDGFAVDISNRQWFVVNATLAKHNVWSHMAPQVAKQLIAADRSTTRQLLIELFVQQVRENNKLIEYFFEEGIHMEDKKGVLEKDIRGVFGEIFGKSPILGMTIDSISNDLRDWVAILKVNVRLWIVKRYVEFGNTENIMYEIPEEYRPELDTTEESNSSENGITRYDVTLDNLIQTGLLSVGESLYMIYNPNNNNKRKKYDATIQDDGSLQVLGKAFSNPIYAALYGIQDSGSNRKTIDGWNSWKNSKDRTLADLRDEYLKNIRKAKTIEDDAKSEEKMTVSQVEYQ
ncbi:MAG: hypothetical protein ACE5KZ_10855 [Candidatus Scalinduaceae bacterium]